MSRSLRDHGIVAALSLALAWQAWTDVGEGEGDSSLQVLNLDADSLERISWREPSNSLTLHREGGPGAEIRLTLTQAAGADETWPTSAAAAEVFASLPRLRALRRLPDPDEAQRRAWHLGDEGATLTLVGRRAGQASEATLRIGVGTYGEHDWVVEHPPGEVFLVARRFLSGLAQARGRLQAREAVALGADQIERITLQRGGARRELHLERADAGEPGAEAATWWVDDALPGHRLEEVEPWLSRCLGLRVVRLLAATPAGPPALDVELAGPAGPPASLQIWPLEGEGAPARSSRFAVPVLLHPGAAEAALQGAQTVAWEGRLSGEPGAAPSATP